MSKSSSSNDHYHHGPAQTELEKVLKSGLSKIEPYTTHLLIACLIVTVAGVSAILWYRTSASRSSVGWGEFISSSAPEDFQQLADKYPDSSVAPWARLRAARLYLEEGLRQELTNRARSDESLFKAKDEFDGLLKSKVHPSVREESLYGLATTLEALSDGDTQPAIAAYRQLLQEFPDSQHAAWSQQRISVLETPAASEFYAWLRKQDPKPPDRPQPRDVGGLPPLDVDGIDLPLPDGTSPSVGTPEGSGPPPLSLPEPIDSTKQESKAPAFPEDAPPAAGESSKAPELPPPAAPPADSQETDAAAPGKSQEQQEETSPDGGN